MKQSKTLRSAAAIVLGALALGALPASASAQVYVGGQVRFAPPQVYVQPPQVQVAAPAPVYVQPAAPAPVYVQPARAYAPQGPAVMVDMGDPMSDDTDLGPLVSAQHAERVRGFIRRGAEAGRMLTGGSLPEGLPEGGAYVAPAVFDGVRPDAELFGEEVFGPVLAVTAFDDEDEALELANGSRYALAASVFTDDLRRAHRVSARLVAGTVTINGVDAVDVTLPFGGFRQSGFGRDLSLHALEKYTGIQTRVFEA